MTAITAQRLARLTLVAALGISLAPHLAAGEPDFPYVAYVQSDDVYVRSGPGKNYYPSTKLQRGDRVEVYRHDPGGWYAIRPTDVCFSWVAAQYLTPPEDSAESSTFATVNSDNVVARVGSEMSDVRDVIQIRLDRGEQVEIIEAKRFGDGPAAQTWYKIVPPAGEFRWVFGQLISDQKPSDAPVRRSRRNLLIGDHPDIEIDDPDLDDPRNKKYGDAESDNAAIDDAERGDPIDRRSRRRAASRRSASRRDAEEHTNRDEDAVRSRRPRRLPDHETRADRTIGAEPRSDNTNPFDEFDASHDRDDLDRETSSRVRHADYIDDELTEDDEASRHVGYDGPGYEDSDPGYRRRPRDDRHESDHRPSSSADRLARRDRRDPFDDDPGNSGDSAPATEKLPPITPENLAEELAHMDLVLAQQVVGEPHTWQLENLRLRALQALDVAETAVERGRASKLVRKVERFQDIQHRQNLIADVQTATDRRNAFLADATRRVKSRIRRYQVRPEYDGAGRLTRIVSARSNTPRYALMNDQGDVACYITPAPGVNLRAYEGRQIGVTGSRGFHADLGAPHVTARRVAILSDYLTPGVIRR